MNGAVFVKFLDMRKAAETLANELAKRFGLAIRDATDRNSFGLSDWEVLMN